MSSSTANCGTRAGGVVAVLYGIFAYGVFLVTIVYAIGFVGNLWVPKSIDTGPIAPVFAALNVNIALLALFAVQHSVMARPAFKHAWTKIVPPSMERSTYVLLASATLILLFWQWQPIPMRVWTLPPGPAHLVVDAIFWLGWGIVFASTFLINHFELFGLRQVFARLTHRKVADTQFRTPLFYRYVRHPLYLGFLLAFWATPTMTAGHLVFAIGTTGYILLGIYLEERDLLATFGEQYRRYRRDVRMLLPFPKAKSRTKRNVAVSKGL